ncbi:hypothetical protein HPB50_022347 [Hyalomma asiaticum]|uniref:Uncharacterized protein n=1 Tax=Hyalomma asiaticum TaxID=266040 RepID=A0ACB7S3B7_HYAAI|nr:hypothetical protein HPB50_022347 [Hyalomma asiaticum]
MGQRRNGGLFLAVTLLTLTLDAVSTAKLTFKAGVRPLGLPENVIYLNLSRDDSVIIVSGQNALYALSPDDLSLRAVYSRGPENDSVSCPPYPLSCDHSRNVTNPNRILLQAGTEPFVLACWIASQGTCSIHDPQQGLNVTTAIDKNLTDNYIASEHSTVAFFGTGKDGRSVLFSGTASDGRPPEHRLFTMSASVLDSSGSFKVLSHARATSANVTDRLTASETPRFIYGFSRNGFAYFVMVRKVRRGFRSSLETRLARVCENDRSSFRTYVDVPISCSKEDGAPSVATSAHLIPSRTASGGGNSAASVLAVAFEGTAHGGGNSSYSPSSSDSVVCFFDMKSVEQGFRETVEDCDKGLSIARLSPLYHDEGDDLQCTQYDREGTDICTPGRNDYVEGMNPLVGRASIPFAGKCATSVTLMMQNGSIVAWIGDSQGILKKFLLHGQAPKLLVKLDLWTGGNMISRNTAVNSNGLYGYFLGGNKVVQIPVGSCKLYGNSCSRCTKNEDPLRCGWCGDHCAHFAECHDRENFSLGPCPIVLDRIYPLNGPVSGGTVLTIEGDNFGSPKLKSYSSIEVLIGNQTCKIVYWATVLVRCRTPPVPQSSKVDVVISVNDTLDNGSKSYPVLQNHTAPSCFEYKVVSINGVTPNYGPIAGGTNISLSGVNLDIGFKPEVKIGNSSCKLRRVQNKFLHCSTDAVSYDMTNQKMPVTLVIDDAEVPFTTADNQRPTFTYKPNPKIYGFSPQNTTFSENVTVEVKGAFLDSAAAPVIIIKVDSLNLKYGVIYAKPCQVLKGGRQMLCYVPSLLHLSIFSRAELRKHQFRVPAAVSFRMDGLHLPRSKSGRGGNYHFFYLPSPHMDSYTESEECRLMDGGLRMLCPGTSLMDSSVMSPNDLKVLNNTVKVRISFQMDGLHLPSAADGRDGYFTFIYQPEPQFEQLPETEWAIDPGKLVVEIPGNHFELFMEREPPLVRVSGMDDGCNVTSVSSHSIVCKMKPGVLEQDAPGALEVVFEGRSYSVGHVKLMTAEQPELHTGVTAALTVAALLILIGVVFFVRHRRRRQRVKGTWPPNYIFRLDKRHNNSDSIANATDRYVLEGNADVQQTLIEAPNDIDEETRTMLERENLLINRELLHLGPVIGQGHFGCVYLGSMKLESKGQVQQVAVKTLHNSSRGGEVDSDAFLAEALIMKDFHHVNVLPLIGLSIDKKDGLMVIIPYMKYGDLLSYIRD